MGSSKKYDMKKIALSLLGIVCVCYGLAALILFETGGNLFKEVKSNQALSTTKESTTDLVNQIIDSASSITDQSENKYTLNDTKQSDLNNIHQISVDASNIALNIIPEKTNEVKVNLSGSVSTSSNYTKPELQCYKSGDTLFIIVKDNTGVIAGFFNSNINLDIYIPSSYNNDMKLSSSSGDININGFKFNNLNCSLSAGKLTMSNISTSTFSYKNSAGNLKANALFTKNATLDSSAGSIDISQFTGNVSSTNSAGDTKIQYASFNNNIDVHSSAGKIEITLPSNAEFNLDAVSSFGDVKSDFPVTVTGEKKDNTLQGNVGNSSNNIKLQDSAGNINLIKN